MPTDRDPERPPTDQPRRRLLIRFGADPRYHEVVRTAVEIYMRPICGDAAMAPMVVADLEAALAKAAPGDPCQVELSCSRPELVTSVTIGDETTTRRWQVEEGNSG
jgi:hypothetical protein